MAKMQPLAELKIIEGGTFFIDVAKISAVTIEPMITLEPTFKPVIGPKKTHVYGLNPGRGVPIDGTPEELLKKHNIMEKYVKLNLLEDPIFIRISTITHVMKRYRSEGDKRIKTLIFPGETQFGNKSPWNVKEELDDAVKLINEIRIKQDAGA